ncbi:hypothetical protein [Megaira polyxenophila phage MAnkyphage_25.80]|nr:hypothetical protein [Megaira polyxenophila phage MAnkyphage_25.80]
MSKNNFWAEFDSGFENKQVTNNFWEEFDNPQGEVTSEPSIGQRIASGAKAVVAGVAGAIPDTLSLAYNLPAMAQNAQVAAGNYQANPYAFDFAPAEEITSPVPLIPSATEAIDQGIDTATGGYTTTPEDQKYINEGLKTGASFLTGGGLAKTAQGGVAKLGSMIGNTSPLQAAGAAAMGGTTSYLADQGAGAGEALGGGLAANLAVNAAPSLAKGAGGLAGHAALSALGLGKNKLNLEAAKAAQGLDIALPKAAASEGKIIALADQFLSKAPIAGSIMNKRYSNMARKVMGELDKAYDSALPASELSGVEDRIRQLYSNSREALPKEAQIVPKNVTSITENIKGELAKSASLSPGEKKVLSIINDYEDKFVPMGIKRIPSPVEDLVASQDSLGKVINWDDTSINWRQEKKARGMQKRLYNAISNDLEEYGKTNPEWYNYHKEADKLFTKLSRRKELEKLFISVENTSTGEMSYNSLSKILNDEQNRARLQNITNPETFERLDKLSKVARAMAIKNKNIPNPSGTASTLATMNVLGAITGVTSYATGYAWGTTIKYLGLAPTIAHLLTDKMSLDAAIRFAENPSNFNAVEFGKRMKQITGYTPVTLLREAQKLEQGKEEKSKPPVQSQEPTKKAPAFNKTIEDMYNNKYIRNFIEAE